jgi:uncharacterized membrane protein YedE/YeeE
MWDQINPWLAGGGLAIGFAFGVVAQRSRFCVVSALSNFAIMRDYRQLHAYLAALGVAVIGTFALEWWHFAAIADSAYRRPALNWLGALGGGLIFGFGAMLAGGCASRTLVRTAEGNLGALLTLLTFAAVAMATMFGVLGPVQAWVMDRALPIGAGDASLSIVLHWPIWVAPLAVGLACLYAIVAFGQWRDHPGNILAGILIGLLVVAGWWVTGVLGVDEFDPRPPASITIAAPLARTATWLAMGQYTGTPFALLLVPGAVLGAFLAALLAGEFRWVAPASDRVAAYLSGGAFMGFGALLAGGCNIGQGLSGAATLSVSSLLAVAGIVGGMTLGMHWISRSAADPTGITQGG